MTVHQTPFTDEDLIRGLIVQDNRIITALYDTYRVVVVDYIRKNSGNEQDADDVWQDTVMVLFQMVQEPDFKLTAKLKTLIYGIAHRVWLKKLSRKDLEQRVRSEQLPAFSPEHIDITRAVEDFEKNQCLWKHFKQLPEGCQKLLQADLSLMTTEEILEAFQFGSKEYLYKRRSICTDKLKTAIQSDPDCNNL